MFDGMISGRLIRNPRMGNTRTGNPMASALLSVRCEQMEATALVSVLAFEQAAEKLGRLEQGDSVSVSGPCRMTEWQSGDGEIRHGISITAHNVMTAFQRRKKGGYSASQRQHESMEDDDE